MASHDDTKALQAKASLQVAETKIWRYAGQKADVNSVAAYLNTTPAQAAGEAMVSGNLGGPFDLWIYL
jgi:predicted AlkP superfamily phosphohydrolase/phosphomutase